MDEMKNIVKSIIETAQECKDGGKFKELENIKYDDNGELPTEIDIPEGMIDEDEILDYLGEYIIGEGESTAYVVSNYDGETVYSNDDFESCLCWIFNNI